ncbi:MAG: OmpA family protein, partial [Bacteroidota bacterium]
MKALYTLLISSVLLSLTYITPPNYVVQVAAYGTPIELSYFSQAGLDGVYRQADQNNIYRYYKGRFDNRKDAEEMLKLVLTKGFPYARVINLKEQRQRCGAPCPEMLTDVTTFADIDAEHSYLKTIYFDYDVSVLRESSQATLDSIFAVLVKNPAYRVLVTGHTDSKGDASYNKRLSKRRAHSARIHLINKGIKAERISTQVYGEASPISRNVDDKGRDSPAGRRY